MRKPALAALLALLATAASAQRPSTQDMTCAEATALITERGAIVLGTGGYTYRRFVAHRGYCRGNEQTEPAWAPTAEGRCRIGRICVDTYRLKPIR
jgi:hypothetical protein